MIVLLLFSLFLLYRFLASCQPLPDGAFQCQCAEHWEGSLCEKEVNYCLKKKKICYNKGQCRPIFGDAICECLAGSYSGDQCEIESSRTTVLRFVSKSFAYVAIIALCSVALFVIIMDILKYFFGIDPVREDREQLQRERKRRKPEVVHFVYVRHSPSDQ